MGEALLATDGVEGGIAIRHCTSIAPDDGWTQGLALLVNAYEAMHLVRDADGLNILERSNGSSLAGYALGSLGKFVPPHFGFLFSPASLLGHNGGFCIGVLCTGYGLAGLRINE